MSAATPPTVPCIFCGTPTQMAGTKKCESCWEVVRRLDEFLRHENGRAYVRATLAELALEDTSR